MHLRLCRSCPFKAERRVHSKWEQTFLLCLRVLVIVGGGHSEAPTRPLSLCGIAHCVAHFAKIVPGSLKAPCAPGLLSPLCAPELFLPPPARPRICCEFVTISGGRVVRGHLRREKLSQMDLACQLCASLSTKMNRPHACRFPQTPLTPTNED